MTSIRRIVLAATLAALGGAALVLASPAAAQANAQAAALANAQAITLATAAAGADYGQHVQACAQTMGLSGDHNPGMHRGYAGWDASGCGHCG